MIAGLLLDTHIALWLAAGDPRLRPRTRIAIEEAWRGGHALYLSPVTVWEAATLARKGRIHLGVGIDVWVARFLALPNARELAITAEIAALAFALPGLEHHDPGDRLLIGSAAHLGCPLVTYDRVITAFAETHGPAHGFTVMS